jgi:N-acetylmuramic acid 6-phosphate etherase
MIMLNTETPNVLHTELDTYATADLAAALIDDQFIAVQAVRAAAPQIAAAIDAALPRIEAGGRLVYVGAGTSGGWVCSMASNYYRLFRGRMNGRFR